MKAILKKLSTLLKEINQMAENQTPQEGALKRIKPEVKKDESEGASGQETPQRSLAGRLFDRLRRPGQTFTSLLPKFSRGEVSKGDADESESGRPLTEQEIRLGVITLVSDIDKLFPESSKYYKHGQGAYGSYEEYLASGFSNISAQSKSILSLSDTERIVLSEEKDPYPHKKRHMSGNRNIGLERLYVGQDGIRQKDSVKLSVSSDGKTVQLNDGRRERETGIHTRYSVDFNEDRTVDHSRDNTLGGTAYGEEKHFVGEPMHEPEAILSLGQEIIAAAKQKSEQPAAPKQEAGK